MTAEPSESPACWPHAAGPPHEHTSSACHRGTGVDGCRRAAAVRHGPGRRRPQRRHDSHRTGYRPAKRPGELIASRPGGEGEQLLQLVYCHEQAAPGTGVCLHNRGFGFSLDEASPSVLAPGKRPLQTIIPALVTEDGALWAVYGNMGGFMQPQGHAQVLVNLHDHAMPPQEAVDHPRHFLDAGVLLVENRVPEAEIAKLRFQLARYRRTEFGRSSEKLAREAEQLELAIESLESDQAERLAAKPIVVAAIESAIKAQKPARRALPEHLPREDMFHAAPCTCPTCGGALRRISDEITETLDYVPGRFKVIRHIREKLSCRACDTVGVRGADADAGGHRPIREQALEAARVLARAIVGEDGAAHDRARRPPLGDAARRE